MQALYAAARAAQALVRSGTSHGESLSCLPWSYIENSLRATGNSSLHAYAFACAKTLRPYLRHWSFGGGKLRFKVARAPVPVFFRVPTCPCVSSACNCSNTLRAASCSAARREPPLPV